LLMHIRNRRSFFVEELLKMAGGKDE